MKLQMVIDEKVYDVEVRSTGADRPLRILGRLPRPRAPIQSSVLPSSRRRGSASEANADARVCRSPVAGIVVRVIAQTGQELQMHDLMLVLEAMKMETNITAPISGKLKCVNVVLGDAVKVDQILLEFE